jgi:hypothetical protein
MSGDFPESDWRLLRELRSIALERLCARVLNEIGDISAQPDKSFHQRYLAIYAIVDRRNGDIARAFDSPRRSQAFFQLAAMKTLGLVEPEELRRFTAETVDIIRSLTETGEPE